MRGCLHTSDSSLRHFFSDDSAPCCLAKSRRSCTHAPRRTDATGPLSERPKLVPRSPPTLSQREMRECRVLPTTQLPCARQTCQPSRQCRRVATSAARNMSTGNVRAVHTLRARARERKDDLHHAHFTTVHGRQNPSPTPALDSPRGALPGQHAHSAVCKGGNLGIEARRNEEDAIRRRVAVGDLHHTTGVARAHQRRLAVGSLHCTRCPS